MWFSAAAAARAWVLGSNAVTPRQALLVASLTALASIVPAGAGAFVWPNVPDQVERALASSDVAERRSAAQRLAELPDEIAKRLIAKTMNDPDVEVRLRAAQAAVAKPMPKAGDLVITWLSEGDARLRLAACDVIRTSPTDRSIVALGRVLGDPDAHVRLAAAAAMGSSAMSEAVSPLLGHLDDSAPEVRAEVARALGRIGDTRAVVPLIGKVQDSVSDVRRVVARALGDLGDQRAAGALMLALQDASQDVRVESVGSLGRLRSDEATAAIAPLVDAEPETQVAGVLGPGRPVASASGSNEVRAAALRALGRIGSDAAVKVLIGALGKDDPAAQRSPVREALVSAGKPAVPALIALLAGSPSPKAAAGAALALGTLLSSSGDPALSKQASAALVRAMQRGAVPLRFGLRALASAGDPDALPTVLELIDDEDPSVRREALRAAVALLDPARPDGRAVDPASKALRDAATPMDEKIDLVRLLGRTGAPRAQAVLLPLATAKATALRLAVLEALGVLRVGSPATDDVLLKALSDEDADVRLAAATALARVASPKAATRLLELVAVAAEQDRGAIGIALAGALARATDAALAAKVRGSVAIAPESARDALIEGLGRMRGPAAGHELARLAGGGIDDRRKVAEALAGHAENLDALERLARDADPTVRANAVWSIGAIGKRDALALVAPLVRDPDVAVAGNAAAAVGRIAARDAGDSTKDALPALCAALVEPRPYVRANALEGLSWMGARCEARSAADLLARDPAESVRLAAADHLARAIARGGAQPAERRALARCAGEDRNAMVAARCARQPDGPSTTDDIGVFVAPDGRNVPMPRAPFALVRPDGFLRLGIADRRGELFEFAVPRGTIRLAVPAPLAR